MIILLYFRINHISTIFHACKTWNVMLIQRVLYPFTSSHKAQRKLEATTVNVCEHQIYLNHFAIFLYSKKHLTVGFKD